MTRLRTNLQFGTTLNDPLAAGDTTLQSAALASLPAVSGSDELLITLDPAGRREIAKITAHSTSATTATVARGQHGTTAQSHPVGTTWVHGAYSSDLIVPCTSSTRPTLGLFEGMKILETDTKREYTWDGSAWQRTGYYAAAGRTGWEGRRSAVQTINNTTGTLVSFDTEDFDSDASGAVGTTPYTIPAGLGGFWSVNCVVSWAASGAYTSGLVLVLGGIQYPMLGVNNYGANAGGIGLRMSAGQTVQVQIFQVSGGALNATCSLNVTRIGP